MAILPREDTIMVKVKCCAECGFLGVRHRETGELVGPGEEQRETGSPPEGRSIPGLLAEKFSPPEPITLDIAPVCAVGACDLRKEWQECQKVQKLAPTAAAEKVIQQPRKCKRFTAGLPGLNPKEHINMNLLQRQQVWNTMITIGVAIVVVIGTLAAAIVGAYISKSSASPPTPAVSTQQPTSVPAPVSQPTPEPIKTLPPLTTKGKSR